MTEHSDLTKNQKLVFDALAAQGSARTAYDILDAVRAAGIRAPIQVYRALDRLVELGYVHRIESLNAFVACAHDHPDTSHDSGVAFAICEDCGTIAEIPLPQGSKALGSIVANTGFVTDRAVVELRGHCAPCRALESNPVA